ncbi:calcium-binding protein [Halovulum sp. GXIMD14794]
MLVIHARPGGFHALSPLGALLPPDVYLNAGPDPKGGIALSRPGSAWEDAAAALSGAAQIVVTTATALDPAERQDGSAEISVLRIDWTRPGADGAEIVGTLEFTTPLTVTAIHDPGTGADAAWIGDLAAALSEAVQHEGLHFRGSAGDDVFQPAASVLPLYAPMLLSGGGGNDVLHGGRADEVLRGGSGDDVLVDTGGSSLLRGGAGDDHLETGLWSQASRVHGGRGDDVVISSNGDDLLWGNAGADRLQGGRGDDVLRGGAGNDRLEGGEGDDVLRGGRGDDMLEGGDGADVFLFRAAQQGWDEITDYTPGEDLMALRGAEGWLEQNGDDVLLLWGSAEAGVRILDTTLESLSLDDWASVQIL